MREMYSNLDSLLDADNFDEEVEMLTDALENSDVLEYEMPTLASTRKETREIVKEELAKLNVMKSIFANDQPSCVEVSEKGESICLLFSDWHIGKVIKIDGETVYDSEIAVDRIMTDLVPQILSNLAQLGRSNTIDDIHMFFLGDLIENDIIYENQKYHIDVPVSEQVNKALKVIIEMIHLVRKLLKELTGKEIPIYVRGITGNHGRAGGKKEYGGCSWDTVLYSNLDVALSYAGVKDVFVKYTYDPYLVVDVKGYKGLLRHWAPSQVQTSAAKAKFGGWRELYDYDFLCYGHYHNWGVSTYHDKPIFRNGSLCGTDGYAMDLALGNSWGQLMWGVNASDPVTFIHRLK